MKTIKSRLKISLFMVLSVPFINFSVVFAEGEGGEAVRESGAYNFGVEGQAIESVETYGKPVSLMSILPQRPVAARDKEGNKMLYTPDGKLTLKLSKDGKRGFSLKTFSLERDVKGQIASTSKFQQGSDKMVSRNEKGQMTGFQQMGLGGKVVKEYDYEGNLTKSTHYNRYGKSTLCVTDELSQTKTVFNSKNEAVCDINFEGFEVAWYKYDKDGIMTGKVDGYGNKTYFGKEGMTYSEDVDGNKTTLYDYQKDDKGFVYLASVTDVKNKQITFYDRLGRKTETKNENGEVVKDYKWDGSTLLFDFDRVNKETTYYDILQRPRYKAQGDVLVQKWLYSGGKLVGDWDQATDTTMIYRNQREEVKIETGPFPPSEAEIADLVDAGLIDDLKKEFADEIGKTSREYGPKSTGDSSNTPLPNKRPKFFQSGQNENTKEKDQIKNIISNSIN